ncbi:hypothetical protein WP4W18E05_28420 [Klebsiella sp. WP4-W18-ESBL-05]|nr:hypothetical protein WP4W18E05_28420 [Klebsiella sp. WP4-W18-ESBL-05]
MNPPKLEIIVPCYNEELAFSHCLIELETILNNLISENLVANTREGANKQVISSQADSLIKISRIWADFFPANTSNQPI